MVLFYHVRPTKDLELTFGFADAFSKYGILGVDVFFVLSGFILGFVYSETFSSGVNRKNLHAYGAARFARIYPLHFIMLFMMLGVHVVALRAGVAPHDSGRFGFSLTSLILSLFLVQEWFGVASPNPVSWSLSVEFASYLIFPILIARTASLPRYWPLLAIALGAAVVELFADIRVIRGVAEFLMGCAVYAASKQYSARPASALAGIIFIIPFLASAAVGHETFGLASVCFAATVFLLSTQNAREPFARLCAARPIVFIGVISYSIYIIQLFVWVGWKHIIARLPFFAAHLYLMVFLAAISVVLCSVVSYYLLENPARSWLRHRLGQTQGLAASEGAR